MVKGDRKPSIQAQLKCADGTIPDLTDCTVKFLMDKEGVTLIYTAGSVVAPATSGIVQYDWATDDTIVTGVCRGEFEITWADGLTTTWPTEGDFEFILGEPYD